MRWSLGSCHLVLLVACACLSCGGADPDGDAERADPIVDEDYRFRIDPPGHGWRLLTGDDVRQIVPDAIAGATNEPHLWGVVIAEAVHSVDLEELARLVLDNMPLENKDVHNFGAVKFKGREAMRFDVTGRISGVEATYRTTIFLNGGYAFQLVCWGLRPSVRPDSFQPFLDSFGVLEGEVRGRQRHLEVVDTHGVGWRVKNGKFHSAALRIAVEPKSAWCLAIGNELEQMNPDAEVGLVHGEPEAYLALIIERAAGADRAALKDFILNQRNEDTGLEPLGETMLAQVSGRPVRMHRFRLEQQPPIEFLKGVFFDRDLCYQVIAWHIAGLRERAEPILPDAFASLRILTVAEAARLGNELQKETDPENRVGLSYCLRRGVYRDFDQGFVFRKPARGFWRVRVGAEARAQNEDATIFLEEPALGLRGLVIIEPACDFTGASFHEVVVQNMFGEDAGAARAGPKTVQLGGVPALSTESVVDARMPTRYRVVTAVHRGRAYQLLIYGIPGNMKASAAEVDRMLDGVRFSEQLACTTEKHGVYSDRRLGFALRLPKGAWRRKDITPEAVRPVATLQQWIAGTRSFGIVAVCGLEEGQDPEWFREFLKGIMVRRFASLQAIEPKRRRSTIAGLPCDWIQWKDLRVAVDLFLLVRDRTFYALYVTKDGLLAATNANEVKRGFRFLD